MDPSVEIDHIEDPILRIIEQYKNYPSIVAINEKKFNKQFFFKYIPQSDVEREKNLKLYVSKASQDSDIPTKIIKMNADIFAEVLYNVFNRSLEIGEFPSGMKLVNVTPVHEKGSRMIKVIIGLLTSFLTYQKSLKDIYTTKFLTFLIPFCQNVNAVSGKGMVRSTV